MVCSLYVPLAFSALTAKASTSLSILLATTSLKKLIFVLRLDVTLEEIRKAASWGRLEDDRGGVRDLDELVIT